MPKFLDGLIKVPVYLVVFLLPRFFLPFTVDIYEFNKLYLLFGLTLLSLLGWFGKLIFVERSLVFRRTPLDLAIAFLLGSALLATLFSQDVITSLLGFYGRFSGGFIELLLWIAFYLIITNNFGYREARRLFPIFFASAFVVGVFFYLSLFGIIQRLPSFLQFGLTPLAAFPQALAMFQALALLFLLLHFSLFAKRGGIGSVFYIVAFLSFLSVLIMVNFQPVWVLLLTLPFLLLVWMLREKILSGSEVNRLSLVVVTALVSLIFLLFPSVGFFTVPSEAALLHQSSWAVASHALTSPPFVGTGLGNFFSAYNLFRPPAFNQAAEWSLRFTTASSHYANIVAQMGFIGIVGVGGFVALTFYFLSKVFQGLPELKREGTFYLFGFAGILFSLALYYQPLPLSLIFWMFLAPLAIFLGRVIGTHLYQRDFGLTPEANLFLSSLFFVGLFIIVLLGYFGGRFYYADMRYRQGVIIPNLDEKLAHFTDATRFNLYRVEYRIALVQAALAKVTQEVRATGIENIPDLAPFRTLAAQAVTQVNAGTALSPNSVVSWENRGVVYRELRGLEGSGNASRFAIESFTRASLLEPTNPVFPVQLAFLHIDADELEKAQGFIS